VNLFLTFKKKHVNLFLTFCHQKQKIGIGTRLWHRLVLGSLARQQAHTHSDTISMHTYNHTQGILKAHKCLQVRQPPSLRRLCDMPCRSIQHRKRVHTAPTAARFRPCYIYHHSAVFPVPSLSFWQIPCQGMLRVVNGEAGSHLPAMRIVWNGHLHCSL
jgi:hypothetical protein